MAKQYTYEFAGSLFRNDREVADAIASQYMTADGANDAETVKEILGNISDDEMLADECIDAFGLDRIMNEDDYEEEHETWLASRNLTDANLVDAFKRFRATHKG